METHISSATIWLKAVAMPCPTELIPVYNTTPPLLSTSTRAYSQGPMPLVSTKQPMPTPRARPSARAAAHRC